MKHQLMKSTWHFKDNHITCGYCNSPVDLWSEHHAGIHYKSFNCECGKKVIFRVKFDGSGHDNFKSKLEEKLKNDSKSA